MATHAILSVSLSTFANKSEDIVNETVHKSPLYSHWFSIEIYNQFQSLSSAYQDVNVTVKLNDKPCTILSQSVMIIVDQFKTISKLEDDMQHTGGVMGNVELCTSELTKSVLYAHALDRFVS